MKSGAGSTSESLEELKRLHHEALTSKADSDQARAEAVAAAAIAQAQAAAASSAAAVDRRARQLADEQVKKLTAALATAEEALKTLAAEQPDGSQQANRGGETGVPVPSSVPGPMADQDPIQKELEAKLDQPEGKVPTEGEGEIKPAAVQDESQTSMQAQAGVSLGSLCKTFEC